MSQDNRQTPGSADLAAPPSKRRRRHRHRGGARGTGNNANHSLTDEGRLPPTNEQAERRSRKRRGGQRQRPKDAAGSPISDGNVHSNANSNAKPVRQKPHQVPKDERSSGGRHGKGRRRPPVLAAIDLGTNNCRLLVAQASAPPDAAARRGRGGRPTPASDPRLRSGLFRITDAFSRIVRLGEGLASTGHLSDDAIERTIAALKICAAKVTKAQPIKLDAVATEACRRAENGDAFLRRVKDEVGIDLRIISGKEEAELALKSCVPLISSDAEVAVVFDIGGGSTEVSVIRVKDLEPFLAQSNARPSGAVVRSDYVDSVSAPVGVVTFSELGQMKGRDDALSYKEMRAQVKAHFEELALRHNLHALAEQGKLCVIGTGGTITTLKALHLGLRSYDRSKVDATHLAREDWETVIHDIMAMSHEQRSANGCIGQGRADLVLPGCAILEGMLDLWPVPNVGVADRGLREGLLVTMMDKIQRRQQKRRRGRRGKSKTNPSAS